MIIDGHLDLAASALNFGRNLTLPLATIHATDRAPHRCTVTIPALLAGGVNIVFGTLFVQPRSVKYAFADAYSSYDDSAPPAIRQAQAHKMAMEQLDYYHRLAESDQRVIILRSWADVEGVLESENTPFPRLGILIHMEGADPIRDPAEVEMWYERGLRSIGLAWHDTRYAPGQWGEVGRLPRDGLRLLERMQAYNMIVDLTHMSETATFEILERYEGAIAATHCNARALVPTPRQLSDTQIRTLAERDGMIGIVLFNQFLRAGHRLGDPKTLVTLDHVVAHIDHICQLLGNAAHVGIGSDFDGGFGAADIPAGLASPEDLPQLATALQQYGYDQTHIDNIMCQNWLRMLKRVLV